MDVFEWADIEMQVLECTKCVLSQTRNKPVFGQGPPDANIFIIGEGPGAEEDKKGLPFVGRSGQLLDKILEACNFTREKHVFIGNIVKCRPPGNRTPRPEEKEACLPYLMKQIDMINPPIIILLGGTALKGLIDPDAKITQLRGNWIEWNNRIVMPTYHPSALLRTPARKTEAWEDFKKVFHKYREIVDASHTSPHISV
ncbi:MAG: uracil-DNA glycosylase [Candidatus Delongbacteria bacterium]|jgi:uracil-DNA glycosylase family 4|nr:uracil-DNA glycosylase [Candidatus Delongbacteria bacterium]